MSRWFRLRFLVPLLLLIALVPLYIVLAQRVSPSLPQPPERQTTQPPTESILGSGRTWSFSSDPGSDQSRNLVAADAGKPLDVTITGPFTHDNLSIFLLHGPDQIALKNYMMLAEAIEKKLFIIHETQSVNELAMENLSADTDVIGLSGDILKGGQQDRIAQFDLVVSAKSGKIPLPAYCVERTAARWMKPIDEKNGKFEASPGQVVSNSLRLAGRYYKSQGGVWKGVTESQAKLSANVMSDARVKESDSSLALSLKVKEVADAGDRYVKTLQPVPGEAKDVVGYAYAINGTVYAADVFGSSELFRRSAAADPGRRSRRFRIRRRTRSSSLRRSPRSRRSCERPIRRRPRAAISTTARSCARSSATTTRLAFFASRRRRQDRTSFLRRNYLKY